MGAQKILHLYEVNIFNIFVCRGLETMVLQLIVIPLHFESASAALWHQPIRFRHLQECLLRAR